MNSTQPVICGDNSFGPGVKSADCRGGLDFTVLFEEAILAILPAVLFIILAPFQAAKLLRRRIRLRKNAVYLYKLLAIGAYTAIQLTLLVLIAKGAKSRSGIAVASAAVTLFQGLSLGVLSHLEHVKSIRPSFLITSYLIATVLLDAARVRTRWLGHDEAVAGVLTTSLAVKCIIIALEAIDKRALFARQESMSSESTSGFISRSLFLWLNPLLAVGYKNVLTNDDLPQINESLDSQTLGNKMQNAWDKCNQGRKYALATACIGSFRWELLKIALPRFIMVALSISQTFLIKSAVEFVQGGDDDNLWTDTRNYGYGLIGAFALVYFGLALSTGWASHLVARLTAMMRGALVTIIYNKLITVPKASQSAALTLMGTDANRIASNYHMFLVDVPPAVVQLGIAIYLLYWQLGAVCISPVLVMIITTGMATVATRFVSPRQRAWIDATQRRVNYSTNILGSLRNIKMLGLTVQMTTNIQSLRDLEMKKFRKSESVSTWGVAISNMPGWLNSLALFAAYAIVAKVSGSGGFSVPQAITSLSLLNLIDEPLTALSYAIPSGWAAISCFARIQEFLLEASRKDERLIASSNDRPSTSASNATDTMEMSILYRHPQGTNSFAVRGGAFGWSESSSVVNGINMTVGADAKLTLVIGPVGCGKSTMLRGLLGETTSHKGVVSVASTKIAYCDQTPWVMNGSIRDNILAGENYEEGWYRTVVQSCALDIDFQRLAEGDSTLVGSKGMKLSGGQKQRLSIARAVYARCDLAVCDDVLSGLDSTTEDIVVRRVFSSSGLFIRTGTPVILATHSIKHMPLADLIVALDPNGQIVAQGRYEDIVSNSEYADKLEALLDQDEPTSESVGEDASRGANEVPKSKEADKRRKKGDWKTYKFYFIDVLSGWRLGLFLSFAAANAVLDALLSVWINWWAASNQRGEEQRLGYWLGIFTLFSIGKGAFQILSLAWLFVYMAPRGCSILHRMLLQAAMKAPLSYISATDTGELINRFTQDLRLSEMAIPGTIINVVLQFGGCVVVIALSINATSYFAVVLPVLVGVLYLVQRFYLSTSRQLRLLEIETNAPVVTNFIESLDGLVTIRSFGWTDAYKSKHRTLFDRSQKPFYLLLCIQQWLVLVLDFIVAGMAVLLVGIAVALRSKLDGGSLGIALVSMMSLSHALKNLVQAWTSLETSFGAIARIKDFSENTPSEESPEQDECPSSAWPSRGEVKFEGVSASYTPEDSPVLRNVTIVIGEGEKIGIVGRTGSGKSSLTLALMRMIDVVGGKISIDGVDLARLNGSALRERLGCLTQDPLLLPATVRANLDPLGLSRDEDIKAALEKVNLWRVLQAKADTSVLDTVIDEDVLSHGQRQLFCLARAILKPGKVLVLDEPTSSVDMETEREMQRVIRAEFSNHTIIMIAHRLSSLRDFDKVVVLDNGTVVEAGRPAELLRDKTSRFAKLSQSSM